MNPETLHATRLAATELAAAQVAVRSAIDRLQALAGFRPTPPEVLAHGVDLLETEQTLARIEADLRARIPRFAPPPMHCRLANGDCRLPPAAVAARRPRFTVRAFLATLFF